MLLNGVEITASPDPVTVIDVAVIPGPQGPAGSGGSAGSRFVHVQSTAAASVNITHGLGFIPHVSVYVSGELVDTDILSVTTSNAVIQFNNPVVFTAVFN